MTFKQSVKSVLAENYSNFNGRASRSEFWYFVLFLALCVAAFYLFFAITGGYSWLVELYMAGIMREGTVPLPNGFTFILLLVFAVAFVFVICPALAVSTRRFHDANWSGWWVFAIIAGRVVGLLFPYPLNLTIIFLLGVLFIIIAILPPTQGPNRYGDMPTL